MPTLRLGRRERICTSGEEPLGLSHDAALGLSAQGVVWVVLDKPTLPESPAWSNTRRAFFLA
jgi:hypothetical protein